MAILSLGDWSGNNCDELLGTHGGGKIIVIDSGEGPHSVTCYGVYVIRLTVDSERLQPQLFEKRGRNP